jgi:hypothetical protein
MRTVHAVARTLACAYVSLSAVACAPHEQAGPFTAVHLDTTNERIVLQRVDDRVAACHGACDSEIPSGEYRIVGSNVSPSEPFVVDGARATFHVDVVKSNARPYRVGRALAIAGGATMAVGALFGIAALATINQGCGSTWFCIQPAPVFGVMAGIFGGVGLLVLVPGLSIMSANPSETTPTAVNRVAGLALHGAF